MFVSIGVLLRGLEILGDRRMVLRITISNV
jgi:hypothetical protein